EDSVVVEPPQPLPTQEVREPVAAPLELPVAHALTGAGHDERRFVGIRLRLSGWVHRLLLPVVDSSETGRARASARFAYQCELPCLRDQFAPGIPEHPVLYHAAIGEVACAKLAQEPAGRRPTPYMHGKLERRNPADDPQQSEDRRRERSGEQHRRMAV